MKKSTQALVALAIATTVGSVQASDFNYNFVEGSYSNLDAKTGGISADANGFDVRGSYLIQPNIFLRGGFGIFDGDVDAFGFDGDIEMDSWQIGAGYILPINRKTDVFFAIDHEERDIKLKSPFNFKDDVAVNSIEAGLRFKPITTVELFASLGHFDAEGGDNDLGFKLGGIAELSSKVGLGISYEESFDLDTSRVFVRVAF
ncbi:outer membrane beta-barrel protein [Permianibacter aggregans]|uniref:Outer membrane protein with beta-barrel domain n=2 Tax=Permianibacter aggregans TaxID=1510150 RepID=A0A4R6UQ63_9GAMM|nr:outer membrane beta-barrel protein [Permianibacter aggregans]TDQ49380.1 outer membrane protein with beta-barrel domain [Permianibacter aggregans]